MFKKFYEILIVLLHPSFWIQLYDDEYPYSKSFDQWCLESLKDCCTFEDIDTYTVRFNGRVLWIANNKLCCFRLHEKGKPKVQPSRYTKNLMWKKLESVKRAKQIAEVDGWK